MIPVGELKLLPGWIDPLEVEGRCEFVFVRRGDVCNWISRE